MFEESFPFPKVGYVNSLEDILPQPQKTYQPEPSIVFFPNRSPPPLLKRTNYLSKPRKTQIPGNSFWDGDVWPFKRLSDLQLGDKKISLNHLVGLFTTEARRAAGLTTQMLSSFWVEKNESTRRWCWCWSEFFLSGITVNGLLKMIAKWQLNASVVENCKMIASRHFFSLRWTKGYVKAFS